MLGRRPSQQRYRTNICAPATAPAHPPRQPALLLRSGITCGGNVGAHLRVHPAFGVLGLFDGEERRRHSAERGAIDMFKVGQLDQKFWSDLL
jgi:hypothetical protein